MFDDIFLKRFWSKVDVRGPNECWEWLGDKKPKGYGKIRFLGRTRAAHQISWSIKSGKEWTYGLDGRHSCDNPPCVNPDHMTPGTRKENIADMIERGRDKGFTSINRQKTHCANGHEFNEKNTHYSTRDGSIRRHCRRCQNDRDARRYPRPTKERSSNVR